MSLTHNHWSSPPRHPSYYCRVLFTISTAAGHHLVKLTAIMSTVTIIYIITNVIFSAAFHPPSLQPLQILYSAQCLYPHLYKVLHSLLQRCVHQFFSIIDVFVLPSTVLHTKQTSSRPAIFQMQLSVNFQRARKE